MSPSTRQLQTRPQTRRDAPTHPTKSAPHHPTPRSPHPTTPPHEIRTPPPRFRGDPGTATPRGPRDRDSAGTPGPALASAVLGHALEGAPSGPRRRHRIWGTWTTNLSPPY